MKPYSVEDPMRDPGVRSAISEMQRQLHRLVGALDRCVLMGADYEGELKQMRELENQIGEKMMAGVR
jgi:hypothetical protein